TVKDARNIGRHSRPRVTRSIPLHHRLIVCGELLRVLRLSGRRCRHVRIRRHRLTRHGIWLLERLRSALPFPVTRGIPWAGSPPSDYEGPPSCGVWWLLQGFLLKRDTRPKPSSSRPPACVICDGAPTGVLGMRTGMLSSVNLIGAGFAAFKLTQR